MVNLIVICKDFSVFSWEKISLGEIILVIRILNLEFWVNVIVLMVDLKIIDFIFFFLVMFSIWFFGNEFFLLMLGYSWFNGFVIIFEGFLFIEFFLFFKCCGVIDSIFFFELICCLWFFLGKNGLVRFE